MVLDIQKNDAENRAVGGDKGKIDAQCGIAGGNHLLEEHFDELHQSGDDQNEGQCLEEGKSKRDEHELVDDPADVLHPVGGLAEAHEHQLLVLGEVVALDGGKDLLLRGLPLQPQVVGIDAAAGALVVPQAKFAVYAATKSYVLSFSRSLAAELKEKGIFVTAVCPGPVDTPFFEVSGKLPGGMKEAVMADPVQVVKQALIDAKYKKEVSVYGTAMKGAEAATKVLPHGMILKAMSMMEKITKE